MRQLLIISILLFTTNIFAQNLKLSNTHFKHNFKITPSLSLFNKLLFNYEYGINNRFALEAQYGFQRASYEAGDASHEPRYILLTYSLNSRFYEGNIFRIGMKYYMVNKKYYINPLISYINLHHRIMNDRIGGQITFLNPEDDVYQAHSESLSAYGFQLNMGKYHSWKNFTLELFGGLGVRKHEILYTVYNEVVGNKEEIGSFLRYDKSQSIYPTFHIGIRMGLGFLIIEDKY